ncbi:CHASE domain-containing protein [Methylobacter tundripaludum]|uniref:histidine kinase n=1 Tax=Methylobacter tundripaludum (strain ATCC BAA-1195 / DSM 17260 / SV96) TaxID=697282 RepID=G3IUL9_METTV|nr:CHASE domain-containing protein [Methylobacter tundripaludum]EGW22742.1 multi-sensor signal transduction histidine kinase [Methylobacter tundripaludum SV96]
MKLFAKRYLRFMLPWLVLLMGLFGTGLAGYWGKLDIERDEYRKFAFYCDEVRLKIEARLDAHKQTLLGGAALFDSSDTVTRKEWRHYVQRLRSDEHFNGIQGLGFSIWIPAGQLAAHQAQLRAEGFPEYAVRPEGKRDVYTAIIFLEPFNGLNLRAFGYDMYSEPVRRAAMEQARDNNEIILSGKVTLVQESTENVQAGTLMYVPVYQRNRPVDTVEQRRAALFGWVYSPFRMEDLLDKLVPNVEGKTMAHVHFRVYDGRTVQADKLLYNNAEPSYVETAQPSSIIEIETGFNGTVWTLQFEKIAGTQGGIDYSKMWVILGAGFLSSFLLFLLLRSYMGMHVNAAKMAAELTTQLRESEQRFRLLADSAPVLIWQAGTDKQCYYFNKGWLEFTGRTLEQEQGNGWAECVHPGDYQRCLDTYITAFDRRKPFSMEYRLRHHDGEYRWLIDTGVPRYTDDKTFLGYIGSCVDITERKQIEDKLARAHAELEQFTRIAAHHLQEPARRLVSFAQRLQSRLPTEQLNEDAIASLHFIEQGAARQSALVRDIQLYLAADQPRSTMETVAVKAVIAGLLEHRATLMRETGAQVDYNDAPSVHIDRPRLKDIFSILLDNALCYRHPKLTPQIRISGEAKAGRVIYRVADNGVGIPAEYRERVFGVFERLQVNDDQNSTGIGLAIVRRIIESCGGSVTIQETPGGGTTVLFDLPA